MKPDEGRLSGVEEGEGGEGSAKVCRMHRNDLGTPNGPGPWPADR